MKAAVSNAHPKMHIATAARSWRKELLFMVHLLLCESIETIGPSHLVGTLVETLPRFAKQPTFVGRVLERRAFGLALLDKIHLVIAQVHEIHRALTGSLANYFEAVAEFHLLGGCRCGAVAVNGGVLEFGCTPIAEHRAVLFGDFTTDVVNRVYEYY